MNLISESVCEDVNNAKEVMELVFREMKSGNIMVVQKRDSEYQVILMGEREEDE